MTHNYNELPETNSIKDFSAIQRGDSLRFTHADCKAMDGTAMHQIYELFLYVTRRGFKIIPDGHEEKKYLQLAFA